MTTLLLINSILVNRIVSALLCNLGSLISKPAELLVIFFFFIFREGERVLESVARVAYILQIKKGNTNTFVFCLFVFFHEIFFVKKRELKKKRLQCG